jgi:hypothetical protein
MTFIAVTLHVFISFKGQSAFHRYSCLDVQAGVHTPQQHVRYYVQLYLFHRLISAVPQGKSTYLRQTGLLTVMAMVGCFVPAEYASFRWVSIKEGSLGADAVFSSLHDSLLTRLSNDDDMEKSLSTFANEMTSSAMILGLNVHASVTHTETPQALQLQKH